MKTIFNGLIKLMAMTVAFVPGVATAVCEYVTVVDPVTGQLITVYVCDSDEGDEGPTCSFQTVVDPATGQFITIWVCV